MNHVGLYVRDEGYSSDVTLISKSGMIDIVHLVCRVDT